jgi:predicted phage terminase large subunit-like protein
MSAKNQADYFVCGTFALSRRGELFVQDIWRERVEIPYQFSVMQKLLLGYMPPMTSQGVSYEDWVKHNPQVWARKLVLQGVEEASSGIGLIQTGRLNRHPFRPLKASENKVLRASCISTMYQNGMVYHKSRAHWLPEFVNELTKFPGGANDDQVDVMSYAGILSVEDQILRLGVQGDLAYNSYVENPDGPVQVQSSGGISDVIFDEID